MGSKKKNWACDGVNDPSEFMDLEIGTLYKWLHLIAYKVSWYLLVAFQNSAWLCLCAVLIGFQALGIFRVRALKPMMIVAAVIGFSVDLTMNELGWLVNLQGEFPFWLIFLWLQFVLLLPIMRSWLTKVWISVLVGAISVPFAYYAGQSLGAVEITWMSVLTHAIMYGTIFGLYTAKHGICPTHRPTTSIEQVESEES